jgi:hypothetical protein
MSRRLPKTVTVGWRTIAVPLSVADRLVNWFSPAAGADRFQARLRMAALHGGYEAADLKMFGDNLFFDVRSDGLGLLFSDFLPFCF